MGNSATAIAQSLRSQPERVFSFQWSDQPPTTQQESVTLTAFAQQDFQASGDLLGRVRDQPAARRVR